MADLAALLPLVRAMHKHEGLAMGAAEEAALALLMREPTRGRILLARTSAGIAGYVVLTFGFSIEFHGVDAFIDELYVEPVQGGAGLGALLLEGAAATARAAGVRALHLEVDHANPDAARLYERLGYKPHPRHLMTKWLDAAGN